MTNDLEENINGSGRGLIGGSIITQNLPGETNEAMKKVRLGGCPGRDWSRDSAEYKLMGYLYTKTRLSLRCCTKSVE
jgi:hypothetical protein